MGYALERHIATFMYMTNLSVILNNFGRILRSQNYRYDPYTPWWRHQMETFSVLLALCARNHGSPVNSPHKGLWRGALMFSLICVWRYDWVNNRVVGELRRHHGHYDVTVMFSPFLINLDRKLRDGLNKRRQTKPKCQIALAAIYGPSVF